MRPHSPIPWSYGFRLDAAISAKERKQLGEWIKRFTELTQDRLGVFVACDGTDPERRRASWDAGGEVIELAQLRAQMPTDEDRERRLERALADAASDRWPEAVMLLSTWPEDTRARAIETAEAALALWPDARRTSVQAWAKRPELQRLTRTAFGAVAGMLDAAHATVLATQDVAGLRAHHDALARLTCLEVSGSSGLDRMLLECTGLTGLRQLALQQPTYSEGNGTLDLAALLAAPHLERLEALSLYGYTLTDADIRALVECRQPLTRVRLQCAALQPEAGAMLGQLAARKRLQSLDLKYNDLGPKGAEALFKGGDWSSLRALDFSANEIGDRGVAALTSAAPSQLRWLNLSSNDTSEQLTAASAEALASCEALGELRTLILNGHPVGVGVAALVESPALRSLRALDVAFPSASLRDILAACSGVNGPPLEELQLGNTESDKPADWSRAAFLQRVRCLSLDSLDGKLYAGALTCPHLEALESLTLGGCYSNNSAGFKALTTSAPPPNLHYLGLEGWKLSAKQATALARSPIGQQLWGVGLMSSYTSVEAWRCLYDAGLPTAGTAAFERYPASEFDAMSTFREV
ncbi:MAG: hypothetical protein R3A51_23065 [Nannocystaceae bacterium]